MCVHAWLHVFTTLFVICFTPGVMGGTLGGVPYNYYITQVYLLYLFH